MSMLYIFINISQQWRRQIMAKEFTGFCGLMLESYIRISWKFALATGEDAAKVIKASQSVYTVLRT
jgi:hypothetical protein